MNIKQIEKIEINNNTIIDVNYERNIWNKFIFKILINRPNEFPNCKYYKINITENVTIFKSLYCSLFFQQM